MNNYVTLSDHVIYIHDANILPIIS